MFSRLKRSVAKLVFMTGLMALIIGLYGPTSAQAEESMPSCDGVDMTQGSGTCADITKAGQAESHTTDKSFAAVGTKGKILTRYTVAAGIKLKTSEKHNKGCVLVHQASQIPAGATCIRGARGFHYKNSGIGTSGQFTAWMDYVGSPTSSTPNAQWMKFVKRGSQWFKAGDQTGAGNCANKVWFNGHGPATKLNWRQVINIRSFANWMFKGNVAVQASSLAEALSKSWCSSNGTMASAMAQSDGKSNANASASYKLRGLTKIKQWTDAKEAELTQSLKLHVNAEAEAFAKTSASAKASTKVECNTPPPAYDECTNIPGDQPQGYECYPAPVIVDMSRVNDLNVNWEATICAKADFDQSHGGTLLFSFSSGGIKGTNPVHVSDMQEGCVTLVAPSDPGTYTYMVTATDSVTGKSVTRVSDPFKVNPEPGIPG